MTGYFREVRRTYYNGRLHVIGKSGFSGDTIRYSFSAQTRVDGEWTAPTAMTWGRVR